MTEYRLRESGKIVNELELRRGFSGVLPTPLTLEAISVAGADPVLVAPAPADEDDRNYHVRDGVKQDSLGNWIYSWKRIERSPEEMEERQANKEAARRAQAKLDRDEAVSRLRVTTSSGNEFDGDEISQGRMARAILALQATPSISTVNWVLADNRVIEATAAELTEALSLAGLAQAKVWVI